MSGRTLSDSRRRWLLGAVVLFLIAIAGIANAGQSEPAPKTNTQTSQPPENTTTRSEPAGQEGPEGLPRPSDAGGSPGAPLAVARAFAAAWINRPTSPSGVARERSTLLALISRRAGDEDQLRLHPAGPKRRPERLTRQRPGRANRRPPDRRRRRAPGYDPRAAH